MAHGHAERNLATVRQLEAETRQLLLTLDRSDPALSAALHEFTNRKPDHKPHVAARRP